MVRCFFIRRQDMKAVAAVVVAALAGAAQGQLIVANDQSGVGTIWHIDVGTGAATALYSASTPEAKAWGMAYDRSTNTLYWNNGGTLYSSQFSMGGLTPTNLGTLTFNGANTNFVGLGFRNGMLVGTRNIATEAVYEISTTTLAATQTFVYNTGFDFGGLDVDATDGKLYGLSDSAPAGSSRGLYAIDDTGGSTAFIAGYPGSETDIDGLAVHNGLAYYVSDGPNTTQSSFYIFDIASGQMVGTLASPFTGRGTFSAAAFVPAPGAAGVMCVGVLAMARRRRS
jgi:hypothetical protein